MRGNIIATGLLAALLLQSIASPVAGQGDGELAVNDDRGDVGILTSGLVSGPSNPVTDPYDLVSLRIFGEDAEGFNIEVGIADLTPTPSTMDAIFGMYLAVDFGLQATDIHYSLQFQLFKPLGLQPTAAPTGVDRIGALFYLCLPQGGCYDQRVMASVDWDKSLFLAYIPKGALAGREPLYAEEDIPSGMPRIGAGSQLTDIMVFLSGSFVNDFLPNTGTAGPYILKSGIPNEKIGLTLIQAEDGGQLSDYSYFAIQDYPQASVTPGKPSLIQVRVTNYNAAKRLVNITAQLDEAKLASQWSLRTVPTLTIPGGQSRIFNLIVNASSAVKQRDEALVRINARSLGFAEEIGVLKVLLVGAVPPSPTSKTLYIHTNEPDSTGSFCIGCYYGPAWMNTLQDDPDAKDDRGQQLQESFTIPQSEFRFYVTLDTPLISDIVFDVKQPIKAHLKFGCSPCPSGTVSATLSDDDGTLATGQAPYANDMDVDMMPTLDRVVKGHSLLFYFEVQGGTFTAPSYEPVSRQALLGKESTLTLPLVPDPNAEKATQRIPLGPAFITLSSENDTVKFLKPGSSKVFPISVVNEGIEEDVVHIEAKYEGEDWSVEITPGTAYRLKPGDSATFGVVVRAPDGSKDGDSLDILLNATSEADASALSQLGLEAKVSENAEDDDNTTFQADEDTSLALEEDHGKSPGPGLVVAVAAVVFVAIVARRRRGTQ